MACCLGAKLSFMYMNICQSKRAKCFTLPKHSSLIQEILFSAFKQEMAILSFLPWSAMNNTRNGSSTTSQATFKDQRWIQTRLETYCVTCSLLLWRASSITSDQHSLICFGYYTLTFILFLVIRSTFGGKAKHTFNQ